jgi:hypothetical protein
VIVGGVLCFFGVLFIVFSIEICLRIKKHVERFKDPEIDGTGNIHKIKHWIQPGLLSLPCR